MKSLHLSLLALIFVTPYSLALKSDTKQPVYINSDTQQVDMKTNRVTFKGAVSLKQGSINIDATKIVVTRDPKNESIQKIQAFGSPATFSQLMDDGKTLSGQANQIDYRISTDELTMKGQAQLKQDNNTIKGSSIRYQIGQQKLVADSSKNERVTTVLQPNQIEN